MTWERRDVTISRSSGMRDECVGYTSPSIPGLAVPTHAFYGYGVTHLSSGCLVTARGVPSVALTLDDAKALAERLATLGDWTRTSQVMREDAWVRDGARAILTSLAKVHTHA